MAIHATAQSDRETDLYREMTLDAYMRFLELLAKDLRNERGDEVVAKLRAKILFQMEIREQELGRPLTGHELFYIFNLALGRFYRTRSLAQKLYRKDRSS